MRIIKTFLIIFILITSCATRQKQVLFTDLINTHESDRDIVSRVFLDKRGVLYPKSSVYIPYKNFFDPYNDGKTSKISTYSGNLNYYFTGSYIEKDGSITRSKKMTHRSRSNELAKEYKIDTSINIDSIFNLSQKKILNEVSLKLNSSLEKSATKTLVVLIHGFNDPNPSGDYQMLRNTIQTITKNKDYVYLEIYWDGLTANQGSPPKSKIWGYAQYNSSYASVTVRKIINLLDKKYAIRLITHSLGASVGTGALFNTCSKWKSNSYCNMIDGIEAPKSYDIRLGMIAPAIPGVNTFIDFDQRSWKIENNSKTNNINKIVVGYNENDFALTKRFLKSDFLSNKFGSTSLGCNFKDEVIKTKKTLIISGYNQTIDQLYFPIDFSEFKKGTVDEEHGMYYYINRKQEFQNFISTLFE